MAGIMGDVRDLAVMRAEQSCVVGGDGYCYADVGDGRGAARLSRRDWAALQDNFTTRLKEQSAERRWRLVLIVPVAIAALVMASGLRTPGSAWGLADVVADVVNWTMILGVPAWFVISRGMSMRAAKAWLRRELARHPRVKHEVASRRRRWLDQIERFAVLLAVPVFMTWVQSLHPRGPPGVSVAEVLILGLGTPIVLYALAKIWQRRLKRWLGR